MLYHYALPLALVSASVSALPAADGRLEERVASNALNGYAPSLAACPSGDLVRAAGTGVNPNEAAYAESRKQVATTNFKAFLAKTNKNFPVLADNQYPTLGLVDGGGGLRGFLLCAGIHQVWDSDEPVKYPTSGLYQSMTYETGLSGSSVSLNSYASNNWPLTSTLTQSTWAPNFAQGVSSPDGGNPAALAAIAADVAAKQAAGFEVTLNDVWARLISYSTQLDNHGQSQTYSSLTSLSRYTSYQVPYPITTIIGIENPADGCGLPPLNASQYEFTPHEFGSWETGIGNFMQAEYVGTAMRAGAPLLKTPFTSTCVRGFDNVGWVTATSTNTFNQACGGIKNQFNGFLDPASVGVANSIFSSALGNANHVTYARMPNPFNALSSAPRVQDEAGLTLIDGGETIQVPPIWPFLYRPDVSVLFISDNSADNPNNYNKTGARINLPSGIQIFHTYQQAYINGVGHRMPPIPNPNTFQRLGYNKAPMTIFGCNAPAEAMLFIYLPNRPIVYNSDIPAGGVKFNTSQTEGLIANGMAIGTNNGDPQFALCLGCAAMKKATAAAGKTLPAKCNACFTKYCAKF